MAFAHGDRVSWNTSQGGTLSRESMHFEITLESGLSVARGRLAFEVEEPRVLGDRALEARGYRGEVPLVGGDECGVGFGRKAVGENECTGHDRRVCATRGVLRQAPCRVIL